MNILFYHYDECCPTKGGIQRTTALLAKGFSEICGHTCFHSYSYDDPYPISVPRAHFFKKTFHIDFEDTDISQLIDENSIDVIINQMGDVDKNRAFREGIDRSSYPCKLIYCHHNTPLREPDLSRKCVVGEPKSLLKRKLKQVLVPLLRERLKRMNLHRRRIEYCNVMRDSDKVILLSKNYIPEWNKITGDLLNEKLDAIPNALSFSCFATDDKIKSKTPRLLVVGRMVDFPKRVSKILKMWGKIVKYDDVKHWELDVVGDGNDLQLYKNYVNDNNIPRVNFYGRAESDQFYLNDSIFVMMSDREGFPMVLCEAQQCGCVPIAYSSFAAIYDVIKDGENGILVPPFDDQLFLKNTLKLMRKNDLRKAMAKKCVESSGQFSLIEVIKKWDVIFASL